MIAVRRQIRAVLRPHDDDRIEEAIELVDHLAESLRVRRGEIALERRGLDLVDRQAGEQRQVSA